MTIWKDSAGALHDDMGGEALGLPTWPQNMTELSEEEAYLLQNPPLTLEEAKSDQIGVLYAAYQAAISQPVSFKTEGRVSKTFQADPGSQDVLTKAAQGYSLAGSVPAGFFWVAADNTRVPFTLDDLKGLYAAMLAQGWTAFQHLQGQKAAVNAATTVAQVKAVTW